MRAGSHPETGSSPDGWIAQEIQIAAPMDAQPACLPLRGEGLDASLRLSDWMDSTNALQQVIAGLTPIRQVGTLIGTGPGNHPDYDGDN